MYYNTFILLTVLHFKMIYKNVTVKGKKESDVLTPISFNVDSNSTTDDQKLFPLKPPRGSKSGTNTADRKTSGSWYMEYHRMDQKSCLKECQEIDHKIPSIDFIETGKLQNVQKDF